MPWLWPLLVTNGIESKNVSNQQSDRNACKEYRQLSRRQVLAGAGAVLATGPLWMPKLGFAAGGGESIRDRLILVNLRGGSDGLTFCAPVGDAHYASSRPNIKVPTSGAGSGLDLDGYFAFPAAFSEFLDPFQSGHMSVLHAVGRKNWTFSHFDAASQMEYGGIANGSQGGWIARHLATVEELEADATIRALNLAATQPTALHGAPKVYTTLDPAYSEYGGWMGDFDTNAVKASLLRQYMRLRDNTRASVRDGVRAVEKIQSLGINGYVPSSGVVYDTSQFGTAMKSTAALMKADIGVEVFHVDITGWDTHVEQGTVSGLLNNKMSDLSRNITALYRDLMQSQVTNWTLVVISEFGRRINENGGRGCEHGEGNTMFVVSPNLKPTAGGKILTDWPGIAPGDRTAHDGLEPTTDDRDVWAEIITKRLNNPNLSKVLPGYSPVKRDLLFAA